MVNNVTPTLPWQSYSVQGIAPNKIPKAIILTTSNWFNSLQTVTVDGVSKSNIVIVSPDPSSFLPYLSAVCRCISQDNNSLVFKCENPPAVNLAVNVLIVN